MSPVLKSGLLPQGFYASGIRAGIKKSPKKDLALFVSKMPSVCAALWTSNRIQASPIKVSQDHLRRGRVRSVVVNSGNANCLTGKQGLRDAKAMTRLVAEELGCKVSDVLVSSTGIIGRSLPMKKIERAIPDLVKGLSSEGLKRAAAAILTTDRFIKVLSLTLNLKGEKVVITGVAKGAGMIAPHLKSATMLAYLFTDARLSKVSLEKVLKEATRISFNAITVDGCMSTNDTVLMMANGLAQKRPLRLHSREGGRFARGVEEVCLGLAKMIVLDGEGATKFIEVNVHGAGNAAEARRLCLGVADSNLVKCAMTASSANWGRIAAALGSIPSRLALDKLDICLNGHLVLRRGLPRPFKKGILKGKKILMDIHLHQGPASAKVYFCDLSGEYVRVNAAYS